MDRVASQWTIYFAANELFIGRSNFRTYRIKSLIESVRYVSNVVFAIFCGFHNSQLFVLKSLYSAYS